MFQGISGAFKEVSMERASSGEIQGVSRLFQKAAVGFSGVSAVFNGFQGVSRSFRGVPGNLRNVLGGSKRFQGSSRACRRFQ